MLSAFLDLDRRCGGERTSSARQSPVKRGWSHVELLRDLRHGELAIQHQSLSDLELGVVESARATAKPAPGDSSGATSSASHFSLLSFKLCHRGEQVHGESATRGAGVDLLSERLQAYVALRKLINDVEELAEIAGETIKPEDADLIASASEFQQGIELNAVRLSPRNGFEENLLASGFLKCVDLKGMVLRRRRNSGVANEHDFRKPILGLRIVGDRF